MRQFKREPAKPETGKVAEAKKGSKKRKAYGRLPAASRRGRAFRSNPWRAHQRVKKKKITTKSKK
jgi:hypothetical protein